MSTVARLAAALSWPHGPRGWLGAEPAAVRGRTPATVTDVAMVSSDTLAIVLRPGAGWAGHRPGQWVRLTVEIDGRLRTRCYTVISTGQDRVEIAVRREGLVSSFLHEQARGGTLTGMPIGLSGAQGAYLLPVGDAPVVLLSGGSGVTGTVALLRAAQAQGRQCTVVHCSRNPDDVPFRDELTRAGARLVDTSGGRPDLLADLPADAHVLACGPAGLVADLRARWGGPLTTEEFAPPALVAGGPRGTVRFTHTDGVVTDVADDGAGLLDQAEKAGLTPAFGCRQGVCRTCVVRLTSGSCLTSGGEPVHGPDATVAICTSVAVGDVTLEGLTSEGEIA